MRIVGHDGNGAISVPPDDVREVRVLVTVPPEHVGDLTPPSTRFDFIVRDAETGTEMRRDAIFQSASPGK
jgi:Ubp3 associated protein Bre5.